MDPRGDQNPYRNIQKVRPDVQHRKIQYPDLTSGSDSHRDVIGGLQSEDQRAGGHLPGAPIMLHPVSGLWDGVDDRVHDGPFQTIAWNGAGGLTPRHSDVTHPDCV